MLVVVQLCWLLLHRVHGMQANMVKQLAKLVKVRFVDDVTDRLRMGVLRQPPLPLCAEFAHRIPAVWPQGRPARALCWPVYVTRAMGSRAFKRL